MTNEEAKEAFGIGIGLELLTSYMKDIATLIKS